MQEWKKYGDTKYLVSNDGMVYSEHGDEILKPFMNDRYLCVDLFGYGIKKRVSVHRMVAIVFIPNPENKEYVNHIDGNKANNRVENLEWVTASENSIHAVLAGLSPIGEQKTLAKLTDEKVREIQAHFEAGKLTDKDLSEMYDVTSGVISSIRLGKTWKHVSGKVFQRSGPNPVKKLSADDIPVIREMFSDGFTDTEIGRAFRVARGTINQIRQGKTWINY